MRRRKIHFCGDRGGAACSGLVSVPKTNSPRLVTCALCKKTKVYRNGGEPGWAVNLRARKLAAVEAAVVKAAMAEWRGRNRWMGQAECVEHLQQTKDYNAACAALARLEDER